VSDDIDWDRVASIVDAARQQPPAPAPAEPPAPRAQRSTRPRSSRLLVGTIALVCAAGVAASRPPADRAPQPVAAAPVVAVNPELEPAYGVMEAGQVFLRGFVRDQPTADALVDRAAAAVGFENVINEMQVRPDAPEMTGTIRVTDRVEFAVDSAVVDQGYSSILDLGVKLMQLSPNVTITVYGHTDSTGDENYNLALSQARVDEVVAYFAAQGIDPLRVTGVPMGESAPVADESTPEGRAANRRIEFEITNILG
jgi:outer membrane protein OmpA-like peptidoglycan-associated protein